MVKYFPQYICWSDHPLEPGAHGDMGAGMDNTSPQGKRCQCDIYIFFLFDKITICFITY